MPQPPQDAPNEAPENGAEKPAEEELTPRQLQALQHILDGETYTSTAKAIGVDRKTLWRWMQKPEMKAAFNDALEAAQAYERSHIRRLLQAARARSARALANPESKNGDAIAVRLLTSPHLAHFAGGGKPGAEGREHSGALDLNAPVTVEMHMVSPDREDGRAMPEPERLAERAEAAEGDAAPDPDSPS